MRGSSIELRLDGVHSEAKETATFNAERRYTHASRTVFPPYEGEACDHIHASLKLQHLAGPGLKAWVDLGPVCETWSHNCHRYVHHFGASYLRCPLLDVTCTKLSTMGQTPVSVLFMDQMNCTNLLRLQTFYGRWEEQQVRQQNKYSQCKSPEAYCFAIAHKLPLSSLVRLARLRLSHFLIPLFSHCLIFSFSQPSALLRTAHKAHLHVLCFHTESLHPFAYFAHLCHCLRARLFSSSTVFVYTDLSCTPQTLSPIGKQTHSQNWHWRNYGTSSISPAPCF